LSHLARRDAVVEMSESGAGHRIIKCEYLGDIFEVASVLPSKHKALRRVIVTLSSNVSIEMLLPARMVPGAKGHSETECETGTLLPVIFCCARAG
jgi:hypothetical protein